MLENLTRLGINVQELMDNRACDDSKVWRFVNY